MCQMFIKKVKKQRARKFDRISWNSNRQSPCEINCDLNQRGIILAEKVQKHILINFLKISDLQAGPFLLPVLNLVYTTFFKAIIKSSMYLCTCFENQKHKSTFSIQTLLHRSIRDRSPIQWFRRGWQKPPSLLFEEQVQKSEYLYTEIIKRDIHENMIHLITN